MFHVMKNVWVYGDGFVYNLTLMFLSQLFEGVYHRLAAKGTAENHSNIMCIRGTSCKREAVVSIRIICVCCSEFILACMKTIAE